MSTGDFLLERFKSYGDRIAVIDFSGARPRYVPYAPKEASYKILADLIEDHINANYVQSSGPIHFMLGDHNVDSYAKLFSLLLGRTGCVVAPCDSEQRFEEMRASVPDPMPTWFNHGARAGRGGLVLFTSGSAGKMKGAVHDGERFLEKFRTPRQAKITIPFMVWDHIGGLNTALHTLSSGGTLVTLPNRDPQTVCRIIEKYKVQVLPTTPTFLRLLSMIEIERYDLSSLETISYGAERMPQTTLDKIRQLFPKVRLLQNYGMTELGIMHTIPEREENVGSITEIDEVALEAETAIGDLCDPL